jgi:putative iron-regulated protein
MKCIFVSLILCLCATNITYAANTPVPAAPPAGSQPAVARPQSYRIAGSERRAYNYDAKAEILGYMQLVGDSYASALADAQRMKTAIDQMLAKPGDDTLTTARDAWINARRSWEQTEAFRFYDGPIDATDTGPGPIDRMDSWPVKPAAIDYAEGNPTGGIINNMKQALTRATLLGRQTQTGPDAAVTTGWHAIEFLLWGEQPSTLGEPGDRPVTDFLPGQPNNDRRRAYLKLVSDMLVEDMHYLVESWEPKNHNSYAGAFRLLNQREALGRIMNGVAQLAAQELATTRLAAVLDSGDRHLLTSQFSEASYQDLVFALRGIRNVWTGDQGDETHPGLGVLIGRTDPALAQQILHAIDHAEDSVGALATPLDRETLPMPPGSAARQDAERAIADLKRVADLIRDAGVRLGVAVYLPN